jgi:hypothetical protein
MRPSLIVDAHLRNIAVIVATLRRQVQSADMQLSAASEPQGHEKQPLPAFAVKDADNISMSEDGLSTTGCISYLFKFAPFELELAQETH